MTMRRTKTKKNSGGKETENMMTHRRYQKRNKITFNN